MRYSTYFFLLLWLVLASFASAQTNAFNEQSVSISPPHILVQSVDAEFLVELDESLEDVGTVEVMINGERQTLIFEEGKSSFEASANAQNHVTVQFPGYEASLEVHAIPLWLSILPPLIAIILALLFKEVIISLFIGIFSGAFMIAWYGGKGILGAVGAGFLEVLAHYVLDSLNDSGHLSVIVFSMMIGGMVAVISRNGGMNGVVNWISQFARTPKTGQFSTWLLGVLVFFDDYANTLVVGNTMRSVTDKLRISREKLSYLVDSTAAPVAALAFITTWIGAELGYIEDGITGLANFPEGLSPYGIFLSSISYSFYPILTLAFMLMLIFTGRDFGPMWRAENRARTTGEVSSKQAQLSEASLTELKALEPKEGIPHRMLNAIIPVLVLVVGTVIGLLNTGHDPEVWANPELGFFRKLSIIIGNSDSYVALLWASLVAAVTALFLTLSQRLLKLEESMETLVSGFKAMLGTMIILTLAWSLALVTEELHTADFLTGLFAGRVSPLMIPAITFLLGAVVSFSTGSSWGTMAILYPLMIPATWQVATDAGLPQAEALAILYNVVACVLAGSVLGDHCSPISDTTILSSLATSCNHIDHVNTQLPYALTVGVVATLLGTIPVTLGLPLWLAFPICLGVLYGIVRWFGREVA